LPYKTLLLLLFSSSCDFPFLLIVSFACPFCFLFLVTMDYVASFFDSRSSSWSYASLRNFNKLSSPVQSHLQKVYLTLAAALLVSALGVYVHTLWHIGGLITSVGFIATTAWLVSTPSTPAEEVCAFVLLSFLSFSSTMCMIARGN
jgi:hypothetical protein